MIILMVTIIIYNDISLFSGAGSEQDVFSGHDVHDGDDEGEHDHGDAGHHGHGDHGEHDHDYNDDDVVHDDNHAQKLEALQ